MHPNYSTKMLVIASAAYAMTACTINTSQVDWEAIPGAMLVMVVSICLLGIIEGQKARGK